MSMKSEKKVCVVGLGYIGLPTAIVAAQAGLSVVGIDVKEEVVGCINQCCPIIQEPEIVEKLREVLETKQFYASTVYEPADYFIIAVPTPFKDEKKADLSYVFAAAAAIAGVLKKGDTVILESTVPVGTTKTLAEFLATKTNLQIGLDFFVAHCPERVLPGNIFKELKVNDRIIGGVDRGSTQHVATFYNYFVSGDLYLTTAETAEMAKLVENSYRDVNIAFAHQVSAMARKAGINAYELIDLANKHPRVNILRPTCGVGGHCIAVDPWFLVESFPQETSLLKEARLINDARPYEVVATIKEKITQWSAQNGQKPCKVLFLGATYKADVDDLRESPALQIIRMLMKEQNLEIFVCEPNVTKKYMPADIVTKLVDFKEGLMLCDIIVGLVAHTPFKAIDRKILAHKKYVDFCGLLHAPRTESTTEQQFIWATRVEDECGNACYADQTLLPGYKATERESGL